MQARDFELGEEAIRDRFQELEAAGFPPEAAETFAEDVVRYASGAVAEGILRKLVNTFPKENLSALVQRYVMYPSRAVDPPSAHDWVLAASLVARRLVTLDCEVRSAFGEGWEVIMPDGEQLSMNCRQPGALTQEGMALPSSGEAMCRLALICVWLMWMRSEAD